MQKNVASQKLIVFAFDVTTNLPKTGDAANITAFESLDYGSVTQLTDTSATEMSSANAAGYYLFDLTQAETNANTILFSAKSSTANIVVVAAPATVFTTAPNFAALAITGGGVTLADAVAHGGTLGSSTATLALSRLSVVSQTTNTTALTITGNGTGDAAHFTGGATSGDGLHCEGGASGGFGGHFVGVGSNAPGLLCAGVGTGAGFQGSGGLTGPGVYMLGGNTSGAGLQVANTSGNVVTITGTVALSSNLSVGGNVTVTGATTLTGAVTASNASNSIGVDLQTIKTQAVTASGGVTFPASTLASTTNISAGTITTVSGNVSGTVGSVVSPGNIWDVTLASHVTAGSTGAALNSAGSAGAPWNTVIPGAYAVGTAGFIVGNNLNATVSSRLAASAIPTNFGTFNIDSSGRVLLQPTQAGVTIPTVTTVSAGVTVTTNNDKSGYVLFSSQTFNMTGNITGNLSGSVSSVTNMVTANVVQINSTTVTGVGSTLNPWGPA